MQENSHKKSIVKQNILQLLEIEGISKYEFYKKTRITRGVLDQNNGMTEENIARFLACYAEIDANWLITGKGERLKRNVHQTHDTSCNAECQLTDSEGKNTKSESNTQEKSHISEAPPPNRDEVVRLLREKVADQQKIIGLLEEKVEALMAGGNDGTEIASAVG